ncbi:hypothetical protein Tsp_13049, partial [Trichinella spiralis]|uniref:hypothetical protein n=1 Tax=Trichinella spiralis TaxID=6334 RepID=UPI0001EFDC64
IFHIYPLLLNTSMVYSAHLQQQKIKLSGHFLCFLLCLFAICSLGYVICILYRKNWMVFTSILLDNLTFLIINVALNFCKKYESTIFASKKSQQSSKNLLHRFTALFDLNITHEKSVAIQQFAFIGKRVKLEKEKENVDL